MRNLHERYLVQMHSHTKDLVGLQNIFRQQYSKIGNTREQLLHAWRLFHFDGNAEMIDAYVNCIRQVEQS